MSDMVELVVAEIERGNIDLRTFNTALRSYGMSRATGTDIDHLATRLRDYLSENPAAMGSVAAAIIVTAEQAPENEELRTAWERRHNLEHLTEPSVNISRYNPLDVEERPTQTRSELLEEVDLNRAALQMASGENQSEVPGEVQVSEDGEVEVFESPEGFRFFQDDGGRIPIEDGALTPEEIAGEMGRQVEDIIDRLAFGRTEGIDDLQIPVATEEGTEVQIFSAGDQIFARNMHSAFGLEDLERSSFSPSRSMAGLANSSGSTFRADTVNRPTNRFTQPSNTMDMNRARRRLAQFTPSQLEQVQRTMWQAGFYGTEAIQAGAVPYFGFLDGATREAWRLLTEAVYLDPSLEGDYELAVDLGIRRTANLHEAAAAAALDAEAALSAPRAPVDMTAALPDRDTVAQTLRNELQQLIGRTPSEDVLDELTQWATETVARENQGAFARAVAAADRRHMADQANRSRFSTPNMGYDSRGYPINSATPNNAYLGPQGSQGQGLAPASTGFVSGSGVNPAEGLTEHNLQAALRALRWTESGSPSGNYAARNNTSSAGGAYQFIDSTWLNAGGGRHGGGGIGNGLASYAPRAEQDRVARQEVIRLYQRFASQYDPVEAWRKTFMSWFLPAWVGRREDQIVPNHRDSLNSYANRNMSRAFGEQSQQIGPGEVDRPTNRFDQAAPVAQPSGRPSMAPETSGRFFDPDQQQADDVLTQYEEFNLTDSVSEELRRRFPGEVFANNMGEQMSVLSDMVGGF